MDTDKKKMILEELDTWFEEGLIDESTYNKLFDQYEKKTACCIPSCKKKSITVILMGILFGVLAYYYWLIFAKE